MMDPAEEMMDWEMTSGKRWSERRVVDMSYTARMTCTAQIILTLDPPNLSIWN